MEKPAEISPSQPEPRRASEHWLTAERFRVYPRILLAVMLATTLAYALASEGLEDPLGKPLGTYFSAFRGGAELALQGEVAAIYNPQRLLEAQQAAIPGTDDVFLWPQPPTLLLVLWPLGLLLYVPGLFLWLAFGVAVYALGLTRGFRDRAGLWAILAFPGAWICALNGQIGLLATGLLAAAIPHLQKRPLRAGLLLGLAGIRPELAILTLVALAAGRCWPTLLAFLSSQAGLVVLSVFLFGPEAWSAWGDSLPWVAGVLAEGHLPWFKLISVYGAARLAGLDLVPAGLLQAGVSLTVLAVLVRAWHHETESPLWKGSLLALSTLLVSPLTFAYDLVLLAPAMLWLAQDGLCRGWAPGLRDLLAAAWILPLVTLGLAQAAPIQVAPLVVAALFLLAIRRNEVRRPLAETLETGRPATRSPG